VLLSSGLTIATGRDGLTGGRPPLALAVTVIVLALAVTVRVLTLAVTVRVLALAVTVIVLALAVTVTYEVLHEPSPWTTVSLVGTEVR
jgi:hypothetical protein